MAGAPTLPGSWYTDPQVLEAERTLLFGRSWHYVGHTGDLAPGGGWFPGKAGVTPLLVTRDGEGSLRALEAVCRHQGAVINPPPGESATVRCAYHGWQYGLDGSLATAPGFDHRPDFDPADQRLPELPVGTWGSLVLAGPGADVPPLAEALGDLPGALAGVGIDSAALAFERRDRARITVNWKQGVEDALSRGAHLVFPATTMHPSPGRLEVGAYMPAGPSAVERLVDSFACPEARATAQPRVADELAEFGRRLRAALDAR